MLGTRTVKNTTENIIMPLCWCIVLLVLECVVQFWSLSLFPCLIRNIVALEKWLGWSKRLHYKRTLKNQPTKQNQMKQHPASCHLVENAVEEQCDRYENTRALVKVNRKLFLFYPHSLKVREYHIKSLSRSYKPNRQEDVIFTHDSWLSNCRRVQKYT